MAVELTIEIKRRENSLGSFQGYSVVGKGVNANVTMIINTGDAALDAELLRIAMPNIKFGGGG